MTAEMTAIKNQPKTNYAELPEISTIEDVTATIELDQFNLSKPKQTDSDLLL